MTTIEDAALPDAIATAPAGGRGAMVYIGPIVIVLALLSALATFLVLTGLTPIAPSHYVVIGLLGVNAVAVLLLLVIIGRETWPVVQARRRGRAGARLHSRIVGLFSIIAAVPAILVAIVRPLVVVARLEPHLGPLTIFYPSLIAMFAMIVWVIFFNRA